MHWKTKQAKNERRRALYHERQAEKKAKRSKAVQCEYEAPENEDSAAPEEDERTPVAKRKALQRAKATLPSSPRKYVSTVQSLVETASPRKRRLFNMQKGGDPRTQMRNLFNGAVHRLRDKTFAADRVSRRILLDVSKGTGTYSQRSSLLGISRKTVQRHDYY